MDKAKNHTPMLRRKRNWMTTLFLVSLMATFGIMNITAQDNSLSQPAERIEREPGKNEIEKGKDTFGFPTSSDDLSDLLFSSNNIIDAMTYVFSAQTGVLLEDMSSGTTQLVGPGIDDTASSVTNIGFDFYYDGVRHTQFSVNPNGLSRLGGTAVSTAFNNATGFATTTNAPKIAPYFEDLCVGTNGKIHFKVIGSAPNRKLVVEWQNMQISRGASCSGPGGGTFQMWLFESAGTTDPGVIQFVYGDGIVASQVADGGATIGLQSGGATNFASVTTSSDTVSYTTHDALNAAGIASGQSYLFTPNVPIAPTGGGVSPSTQTTLQLNWTDNATNEVGYVVFRSTDNVNFALAGQTAANAVMFNDTGLTPGTQYFYQINAITEGVISSALAVTGTTFPPGVDTCAGAGGDWNNVATWTDGSVPTSADNVTIGTGCTVTVNVTNAVALNLNVESGGTLQSPTTGTVTTNNLTVSGNVTNNGTLDFSTNSDTSGAILTFGAGNSNVTFGGTGATTDVRAITVAKGVQSTVVELLTTNFTVRGVNTDVAGYLTLTSGTFKISGTFTMDNRTFPGPTYAIPLIGGFWLNNPNYTVSATASGTTTNNNGLLRMTQGVYNIGLTGAHGMGGGTGATFIVEGGTINATRIDPQSAVTWTQTAGTINIGGLAGNTRSSFGSFELFSTASVFNMSGGEVNLINSSVAATPIDYQVRSSTINYTGGVVNVGTAATATNFNFRFRGNSPAIVIDNTGNAKTATFTAQTLIRGNVTVSSGTTFDINGFLVATFGDAPTSFVNNGAVVGNTANSRLYLNSTNPLIVSGSGTFGLSGTPLQSLDFDSSGGVTLDQTEQIITLRTIMFTGNVTNSGKITLGDGGATTGVVQIGNTTTPTNAGVFDQPFSFNIGTGGQILIYLRTTNPRSTGPEIVTNRNVTSLLYDDNAVDRSLTVGGGNLIVTGALTLTNGIIQTDANILSHSGAATRTNGYVNGNLHRAYTAPEAYTYHVGQNGYSPVLANVTASAISNLGGPGALLVRPNDNTLPGLNPTTSVSRNWTLTESNSLTADLTFTYLDGDVNGNEADYRIFRLNNGALTNECSGGPCVNEANNTATVTGISDFSDWGIGEDGSVLTPNIDVSPSSLSSSQAPDTMVNQMLAIGNTGAANLNWSIVEDAGAGVGPTTCTMPSDVPWLSLTPTMGTTTAGNSTDVTVTFDSTGLAKGMYAGNLCVSSDDPDSGPGNGTDLVIVPVSLEVTSAPGVFSVDDVRVTEPVAGAINATFTVSFTGTGSGSVDFATANGTAVAGSDYVSNSGTLNFGVMNGNGPQTQTVSVVVNSDAFKEANETFFFNLSMPVNGTISDNQGVGIIVDRDRAYVSDFDNDKITDYTVYRPSTSTWYVLQSTNGVPKINEFGASGDIAVPGDYDGDGITDRAVFRPTTGDWHVIQSQGKILNVQNFGLDGDIPVQGDYDGDGQTDFAVYRPSNGKWYILQSQDGWIEIKFGISTDTPVTGDFDGDAKNDLGIYRDGVWYILRSSDASVTITSWGLSTDIPVSGDFDGDGSADLTIYRDGVWWILDSLTNTSRVITFGLSTDIPAVGDFDGDGTSDVGVFRPTDGDWYVLRSSDNTLTGVHWGTDGDVPIPTAYTPQCLYGNVNCLSSFK